MSFLYYVVILVGVMPYFRTFVREPHKKLQKVPLLRPLNIKTGRLLRPPTFVPK